MATARTTPSTAQHVDALVIALSAGRIGFGLALVAAPDWLIWQMAGKGSSSPVTRLFARGGGVRDVLVGIAILDADSAEERLRWLARAGFCDLSDSIVSILEFSALPPRRRALLVAGTASVGAGHLLLAGSRRRSAATLQTSDEPA